MNKVIQVISLKVDFGNIARPFSLASRPCAQGENVQGKVKESE